MPEISNYEHPDNVESSCWNSQTARRTRIWAVHSAMPSDLHHRVDS